MGANQKGFGVVEGLLVSVALGVVGFAGWYVYDSGKKTNSIYDKSTNVDTATKLNQKQTKKAANSDLASTPITEALIAQVSTAVTDQKYSDLDGVMKDMVTVVLAASEKGGEVDKATAIKDLDYLKSATVPWNFNLDQAELDSYADGDYKQYFTDNTIFGKSADGMVVAFGVNDDGIIDAVFMAANAELLTQ